MQHTNMIESLEGRTLLSIAPIGGLHHETAIVVPLAKAAAPAKLQRFSGTFRAVYNSTSGSLAWADTVQGTILVTISTKKAKTTTSIQLTGTDTYLPLSTSTAGGANDFNKTITLKGSPAKLKGKTTLVTWSSGNALTATLSATRKASQIAGKLTLAYGGGGGTGGTTIAIKLPITKK